MRGYNIWRPLLLLISAYLVYNIINVICLFAGVPQATGENIAFMGAIVTAVIAYSLMQKNRGKNR